MKLTAFLVTLATLSVFSVAASDHNYAFTEQEKNAIKRYFQERDAARKRYDQYHPPATQSPKPTPTFCPNDFAKGNTVNIEFLGQSQTLSTPLAVELRSLPQTLTVVRSRCVYRIQEHGRTLIDWIDT